jgi:multidrug efflux pump subunit AcrB
MSAAEVALRHRRAILLLTVAAAFAGLWVARGLPKGVYPEVTFPREQVVADLSGASVDAMLAGVTRPIEASLASIPGLRTVRSRTIRGGTEVSLFFEPRVDMTEAHSLVSSHVAELRSQLPHGTELTNTRVLPSGFPILSINVEGPYPAARLYELAQYTLRPALIGIPGEGPVSVQSSEIPEVEVVLDLARLQATHLTIPEVADKLRQQNQVATVARLSQAHELSLGLVSGELRDVADVEAAVVGGTADAPVRVRDLGTVELGVAPQVSMVRVDGRPGAIINVTRQAGGDILAIDAAVRARLAELAPTLPPGVVLRPAYAQARFVDDAVSGVRDAVLFGALFAIVVLALFLRDARATLLAALSLPLTLGASLLALRLLGQTLNLMTLGGLAVAVGLIIDDAVVVIEAVHRHLEEGLAPDEAARRGTDELFWPVVGTTATTVVVFAPLALLEGVAGQFFTALSLALASAVILSLPVALLVLPGLAANWLRPVKDRKASRLGATYARWLDRALTRRWPIFVAAAVMLGLGAFAFRHVGSDFLPEADEGAYVLDYYTPVGASLADADGLARALEQIVTESPEVDAFSRRLGAELGPPTATLSSRGDIAVELKTPRERPIEEILAEQRRRIAERVPGVRVEFVQVLSDMLGDLQGSPEPVELKIFGPDPEVLRRLAGEASGRIKDLPGLVDLFGGDDGCAPELTLAVDGDRAARQGLTATTVADQLSGQFVGEVATELRRPDRLLPVRVRGLQRELDVAALGSASVINKDGQPLPAASLGRTVARCPRAVALRENGRNLVHVTARLSGVSLGNAATGVLGKLKGWKLPEGYGFELGGLIDQQRESFHALLAALLIAVVAVAVVLLFQLRSTRRTLAVLAAAPIGLGAGIGALAITGVTLNVSSIMGGIVLVGLVVKNGILLLDHAQWGEDAGLEPRAAMLAAAEARLRPILMTTLATLVALLPLVLGIGAGGELHRPLAIVVVGGLAISTAATLFMVPALALGRRRAAAVSSAAP